MPILTQDRDERAARSSEGDAAYRSVTRTTQSSEARAAHCLLKCIAHPSEGRLARPSEERAAHPSAARAE